MQKFATIDEIRRNNLIKLANQFSSTADAAKFLDKTQSYLHQILEPSYKKSIGSNLAREIEKKFNKPSGWLDHEHGLQAHAIIKVFLLKNILKREKFRPETFIQLSDIDETLLPFGALIDQHNATFLFPEGSIVIMTQNIDKIASGDLVALEQNGQIFLQYAYLVDNLWVYKDLDLSGELKGSESGKVVGIALRSVIPTKAPDVDKRKFTWLQE